MAASVSSNDLRRSFLLEQIAKERREVAILESERALLLSQNRKASRSSNSTCARKRHRPSPAGTGLGTEHSGNSSANRSDHTSIGAPDERDLLDVLDALQCRVTLESMVAKNKSNMGSDGEGDRGSSAGMSTNIEEERLLNDRSGLGEVDGASFRLHPILGGLSFTKVEGPLSPSPSARGNDVSNKRLYVLSGHAIGRPNDAANECIGFEVRAEVSFTNHAHSMGSPSTGRWASPRKSGAEERASVSSVKVRFSPHLLGKRDEEKASDATFTLTFPAEELSELAQLVEETRSLTKLFRELVSFQEFHYQRAESFKKLVNEVGSDAMHISSANIFSMRNFNEVSGERGGLLIKMSWSRIFSELGRDDKLCVEECSFDQSGEEGDGDSSGQDASIGSLLEIVTDPGGVSSLVHCVGCCEEAIRIMLKAIRGQK